MADPGRPPIHTPELEAEVLRLLSEGKSLREIADLPDMPARATVYKWIEEVEGFSDRYSRARALQQHSLADDTLYIAQTVIDPHRARVMIAANQWHAGKLAPKVYGEHIDVNQHIKHELPTAEELAAAKKKLEGEL